VCGAARRAHLAYRQAGIGAAGLTSASASPTRGERLRSKRAATAAQDYFDIVKRPMDLETVGRKLEHKPERGVLRQYREPAEFREDMRQIWTNCRLYNAVGTPVRGMVRPARRSWARSHAPLAGAQPAGREPATERRGSGLWGPARSSARACWGTGRQRRSASERGTGACCPAARGGAARGERGCARARRAR